LSPDGGTRIVSAPTKQRSTMPRKKKEETIDDIIDRIESDLETIRDKSVEDQDWEDDIDEEDIDEDEDDDYYDEDDSDKN
jgi:hypothetical protein